MIDAKAYDHRMERVGVEWKLLGIALTKFDTGKRRARQLDLGAGEIEPDCMSAAPGSRGRDVSGTCRHIQNPRTGCDAGGVKHRLRRLPRQVAPRR